MALKTYDTTANREDLSEILKNISASPTPLLGNMVHASVSGATISATTFNKAMNYAWSHTGDLMVEDPEEIQKEEMVSLLETLLPYGRSEK